MGWHSRPRYGCRFFSASGFVMPYRNFAPAIVSIHPKRAAARSSRMPGANRRRVVSFARVFVTGVALSLALSGCGVFCNIGGGSGGVGGSCAIGTGFRF
ncbi:hypothetical protein [Paraburkholderia hospita]|jgi:hypothetical protein|uniref:hypothetical protein n=1 Tax=Paraburkholderia hospita TaxID=169430 RepID=UPI00117860C2|nr:hypothetical protein [Paraburkholderia hospita]